MLRRRIITLLLVCVMLIGITACGPQNNTANGGNQSSNEPVSGGVLNIAVGVNHRPFFQPSASNFEKNWISPVVEPLARYSAGTGEIDYILAEDMKYDSEKCELVIKLRDGISFTDGSKLNADVLIWDLNMFIEKGNANSIGNPTAIEKVDDLTVRVTFKSHDNSIMTKYTGVYVYSQKAYEEHGEEWYNLNLVGTGPYILKEYVIDSKLHFEKNPDYWGTTYFDEINIIQIADATAMLSGFLNGEFDYMQVLSGNDTMIDTLQAEGYTRYGRANGASFTALMANSLVDGPFKDKRVREAVFRYAVDWDAVCKASVSKYSMSSGQLALKEFSFWNDEIPAFEYNVEKAKKLLAEAGYPNGFEIDFYVGSAGTADLAAAVQDSLKAVGIKVNVISGTDALNEVSSGKPGIVAAGAPMYAEDLSTTFVRNFAKNNRNAKITYLSDEYYELVKKYQASNSTEEMIELVKQMSKKLVYEDLSFAPICCTVDQIYFGKNVRGIEKAIQFQIFPDVRYVWKAQ